MAVLPIVLAYALGGSPEKLGSVFFIGISLIIASVWADGGCEAMAIPDLLFGKRTHLVCLVFSPIDWLEVRLCRRQDSTVVDGHASPQ